MDCVMDCVYEQTVAQLQTLRVNMGETLNCIEFTEQGERDLRMSASDSAVGLEDRQRGVRSRGDGDAATECVRARAPGPAGRRPLGT